VIPVPFRSPGPDRRPSGAENQTLDIEPRAGGVDFDDSTWEVFAADDLARRRGTGRVCFGWYRLRFTLPEHLGEIALQGTTVEFELVLDDYAEVWVDGRLPRRLGQVGGSLIAGFNAPNRLVLTHRAHAGQRFTLAIFGANGPLSDPPANYLWIRSAVLRCAATPPIGRLWPCEREPSDPRFDDVLSPHATVEVVSDGHTWVEGPAWDSGREGLFFSDIPRNAVYFWQPGLRPTLALQPSGYTGTVPFGGREPGSNGLAVDAEGRLWLCQHGDRCIARREADGSSTKVVERYEGKRLNSPNDLLLAPNGDLWFTDPPFGLPRQFDDPARELPGGVYRRTPDGAIRCLLDDLRGPNGLALSPDNKTLWVSDADPEAPKWLRCTLDSNGAIAERRVVGDAVRWRGVRPGFPDGMKVDAGGNLFACGPGGLYVFAADGTLLGALVTGVATSNCAFGADLRTLFVTAGHAVLCVRW
jgi:gluconolactonase